MIKTYWDGVYINPKTGLYVISNDMPTEGNDGCVIERASNIVPSRQIINFPSYQKHRIADFMQPNIEDGGSLEEVFCKSMASLVL